MEKNTMPITFVGALQLLFLGLKLGKAIDWKWIWVFSPTWIPAGVIVAVLFFAFLVVIIKKLRK